MSGKYFVDVSRMNDVSKLLGMLSGYTKLNWSRPTNHLYIDVLNKVVGKEIDNYVSGHSGSFKRVGYDEIVSILEDASLKELDLIVTNGDEDLSQVDYTDSNLLILNDYLKNGTKIQFNISGTKWHNVTGKFKLEQLKHKSMKLRYKPECVEVDGVMMKPDAVIKYINKHYSTEVDGDKH